MDTQMDTPTAKPWMTTAPTQPGIYHFTSAETDGDWEVLRVGTWLAFRWRDDRAWAGDPWGRRIGLYVDCPHVGMTAVTDYHNGLIEPRWRWLGNPIGNRNETQMVSETVAKRFATEAG